MTSSPPYKTAGPAKRAAARFLSSDAMGRSIGTLTRHRIRSHDLVFDTSNPSVSPRVEARLFWRLYESSEIRLVRRHFDRAQTIVDLGASLGFTGAHALTRMQSDGRYIAVEANASLLPFLGRTLEQHGAGRVVDVLHAAVSYDGKPTVRLTTGPSSVASRLAPSGKEVPAITLSALVNRFDLDSFCLLSDIEGAEAGVILEDTVLDRCDRLVIELHETVHAGCTYSVHDLHDALIDRGFRTLEQQGPVFAMARTP